VLEPRREIDLLTGIEEPRASDDPKGDWRRMLKGLLEQLVDGD
jgi:hypothetical protein